MRKTRCTRVRTWVALVLHNGEEKHKAIMIDTVMSLSIERLYIRRSLIVYGHDVRVMNSNEEHLFHSFRGPPQIMPTAPSCHHALVKSKDGSPLRHRRF